MGWVGMSLGCIRAKLKRSGSGGDAVIQSNAASIVYAAAKLLLSRFSRVQLCATPYTAAHQAPPSLGFSRQEHWSGLPFPSPMHENEK